MASPKSSAAHRNSLANLPCVLSRRRLAKGPKLRREILEKINVEGAKADGYARAASATSVKWSTAALSIQISYDQKSSRWSLSYSRHLFVVVGMAFLVGGIAALAGPWWLPVASFVFGRFDVKIDPSANYWVAAILIAVGLSILAFKFFVLDKWARRLEIDKNSITKSPPAVKEVKRYLEDLLDDHSYRSSSDTHFHFAYNQFSDASTAIQDKKTATLFGAFSRDATALHIFVGQNFFVFPNNQGINPDYKYCLAPHLNIDRDMAVYDTKKVAQYDELKRELAERVARARQSYEAFVGRLKQLGHL
jgi:hypothetical protein